MLGAESYNITSGTGFAVSKVRVIPIIAPSRNCDEGIAEASISTK